MRWLSLNSNGVVLDEMLEDTLSESNTNNVVVTSPDYDIISPESIDLNPVLHSPKDFQIKELDKLEHLIELHVLDYSGTPTSTHKGEKARFSLDWCANNDIGIALFGNFGTEIGSNSEGSGMDATEFFANSYPDVQVIGFAPLEEGKTEAYITREKVNPHLICGKEKIRIHIDCDEYLAPKRLEEIFRSCIMGEAQRTSDPLANLYSSEDAKEMARDIANRRTSPNCKAITNVHEFASGSEVYSYNEKTVRDLREMDIIVSTIGSGERFLDQIKSVGPTYDENGEEIGPIYIAVTTQGNPLAGWLNTIGSRGHNRLDTPYSNPAHEAIKEYIQDSNYDIRLLVIGEDEKTLSAGVATRIKSNVIGDLALGETGSLGFSALLKRNCMTPERYLAEIGIDRKEFPDTYKCNSEGLLVFPNLAVPNEDSNGLNDSKLVLSGIGRKYRVCVVYTGSSQKVS